MENLRQDTKGALRHLVLDSHDEQPRISLALRMNVQRALADVEKMAQVVVQVECDLQPQFGVADESVVRMASL